MINKIISLYAGTSENPTVPKGENLVGADNQQAIPERGESSTTTRETSL